jgi:hypothetical protein
VDAGEVFWSLATGEVSKLVVASCCSVTSLASGLGGGIVSLAVDASHVYWVSQSSSAAQRVQRGGGTVEEVGFVTLGDGWRSMPISLTWARTPIPAAFIG